jgi:hypothetical protein
MRKTTNEKIKSLSDNLLRLRVIVTLQKQKLKKQELTVQSYLAERDVELYDNFVSDVELEFNMYKYLLQHTAPVENIDK